MLMPFRIVRYAIVGGFGLLTDFAVTWLLKEKLKVNQYWANAVGFLTAVAQNYWLNTVWTFRDRMGSNVWLQGSLFLLVSLSGLLFNTLVLKMLNYFFANQFYLNKLLAIGVVFIWNFLLNNFVTFVK
ncbi:MAG: glycosyl transferase family 2 [Pseudopedobacter saltans]|uniref:Glycosyl transferase family 2 n=1 Tax=Pseudopedobacter saltans TaxID=151895 RepID=A0A2W5EXE8_9SPHI|nr:MAG: glycosyl transferase family 2 [Pseudopedobacter saltans]